MIKKQRAHVNLRRNYKNKISLPIFLSELSKVGTDEILQFSIFLWIFIFPKEIQTHLIWHLTFKGSNPKVKEKEKKMDKKHHIISKAYLEWVNLTVGHKLYINVLWVYGLDSVLGLLTEELDWASLQHLLSGKGTRRDTMLWHQQQECIENIFPDEQTHIRRPCYQLMHLPCLHLMRWCLEQAISAAGAQLATAM